MIGSNGDSGDVAMEGKMTGCCRGTRDGLEEGGKRGSDRSTQTKMHDAIVLPQPCPGYHHTPTCDACQGPEQVRCLCQSPSSMTGELSTLARTDRQAMD